MNEADLNRKVVSNEPYFEYVKEVLAAQKLVKIAVSGKSMSPFLLEGDQVILKSMDLASILPGNIVLAYYHNGYILHRVIKKTPTQLHLTGDHNDHQVEYVDHKNVFAVVHSASRNGRVLRINALDDRLKAMLWYYLRPFRTVSGRLKKIFLKRWR